MFTIDQVKTAHAKVKSGADFPQYIQDIKALGVKQYDNYVEDGRIIFSGSGDYKLVTEPKYAAKPVNGKGSKDQLSLALGIHQQGHTDYLTFCDQAAAAGVEKWTTDLEKMEVTYYDKQGNILLSEAIPAPL